MADGSEASANLIMDPNDGIFYYDATKKVAYTVDAKLVTEDGDGHFILDAASHVNLHVDCGE